MGGLGTRTSDMYNSPKPFINLFEKYLFEYALSGFNEIKNSYRTKLTMIVRNEIMNDFYIKKVNHIGWNFSIC